MSEGSLHLCHCPSCTRSGPRSKRGMTNKGYVLRVDIDICSPIIETNTHVPRIKQKKKEKATSKSTATFLYINTPSPFPFPLPPPHPASHHSIYAGSSLPNELYHVPSLTPFSPPPPPALRPGALFIPDLRSLVACRVGSISLPGSGSAPSAVPDPSNPPSVRFLPWGPAGLRCRWAAA